MARKTTEEELRDNMYRLKLDILNERIQQERTNSNENIILNERYLGMPYWTESRDMERDFQIKKMNLEINDAKMKYEKLKEKIREQKLENEKTLSLTRNLSAVDQRAPDKFSQYMEMLMIQQTQAQNMLMNQLFLKNNHERTPQPHVYPFYNHQPTSPPNPPPSAPIDVTPIPKPSTPVLKSTPPKESNVTPKPLPVSHSYPGNEAQQTLRKLGLAALFCSILESDYEEKAFVLSDKFLFELKLKEVIKAIQKFYLHNDKPIYILLKSVITNDLINYRKLVAKESNNNEVTEITNEINKVIQSLISNMAEIMPINGILGCDNKSILSEVLQTNQTFPDKYFYTCELDLIKVDSVNIVRNVGVLESQIILIGLFFIRSLVTTVMMQPEEYGLTTNLSTVAKDNLRILSSLFVKLYRIILSEFVSQKNSGNGGKRTGPDEGFIELRGQLLTDVEIEPFLKVVKKSFDFGKPIISKWASTYVSKLKPL